MKKLIASLLLAALVLSLCACGPVNEKTVAVLWAEGDKAVDPNTLINAMDRAMYIENVSYTYYGAQGDAAKQLQQAQEALAADCGVLMVEPVDDAAAAQFVELAKAKNVPLVFFGCEVEESVVSGYDKCVLVKTNEETLGEKMSEMVSEYLKDKKTRKNVDRNGDGKIALANLTGLNLELEVEDVEFLLLDAAPEIDPVTTEMVLTADDTAAQELLVALQAKDYNTDKLVTQSVAIFTVGNEFDYKAYVLEGAPEDAEGRKAHFEANKFLVDLTAVEAEDLDAMIYTTANVIDTGRIMGTAMEDYDAIAEAAAKACATLATGKTVAEAIIAVDYTTYAG